MRLLKNHFNWRVILFGAALGLVLMPPCLGAFQRYVIRSRVTAAIHYAVGAKAAVADFHHAQGVFPANNAQIGITPVSHLPGILNSLIVKNGEIVLTLDNHADFLSIAGKIVLTPRMDDETGQIEWFCGTPAGFNIEDKYLPRECQGNQISLKEQKGRALF